MTTILKLARQVIWKEHLGLKVAMQFIWEEIAKVVNSLPRKVVEVGPPTNTASWAITHGIGSTDVVVIVKVVASSELDFSTYTVTITDDRTVTITNGGTITANTLSVVILG